MEHLHEPDVIDITIITKEKFTKEEVLIRLWECMMPRPRKENFYVPTIEDARKQLEKDLYVDIFYDRPIKTDFKYLPKIMTLRYDNLSGYKGALYLALTNDAPRILPKSHYRL